MEEDTVVSEHNYGEQKGSGSQIILSVFPSKYIVDKKNYLLSATKMMLVIGTEDIQLTQLSRYATSVSGTTTKQRADITIDLRLIERIHWETIGAPGELTIYTTTN
jgi:hypothetical protein